MGITDFTTALNNVQRNTTAVKSKKNRRPNFTGTLLLLTTFLQQCSSIQDNILSCLSKPTVHLHPP